MANNKNANRVELIAKFGSGHLLVTFRELVDARISPRQLLIHIANHQLFGT